MVKSLIEKTGSKQTEVQTEFKIFRDWAAMNATMWSSNVIKPTTVADCCVNCGWE